MFCWTKVSKAKSIITSVSKYLKDCMRKRKRRDHYCFCSFPFTAFKSAPNKGDYEERQECYKTPETNNVGEGETVNTVVWALDILTFQQRLESGDFLQFYDIWVTADVPWCLSPLGHHHNIIHFSSLLGWRRGCWEKDIKPTPSPSLLLTWHPFSGVWVNADSRRLPGLVLAVFVARFFQQLLCLGRLLPSWGRERGNGSSLPARLKSKASPAF